MKWVKPRQARAVTAPNQSENRAGPADRGVVLSSCTRLMFPHVDEWGLSASRSPADSIRMRLRRACAWRTT
jgi:hypothetical protein